VITAPIHCSVFARNLATCRLSSVSRQTGGVAFTAMEPTHPPELFVCSADGSGERQLTHLNRDWGTEVELSNPERFRFNRAGFDIEGWVMRARSLRPSEALPRLALDPWRTAP
jgi:dipeptidyl aminopeptidase/acylaminoacyl peptidase